MNLKDLTKEQRAELEKQMREEKVIYDLTTEELAELIAKKREQERCASKIKREAYEGIKADLVNKIEAKLRFVVSDVNALFDFVVGETSSFYEVMKEYGKLRSDDQMSYRIKSEHFKIEVNTSKKKKFDERADIAAARLIDFLRNWISNRQDGEENPMYQLAMLMIERNKEGELDYKSISRLYALENKFSSPEYTEIMQLFKESNVVDGTSTYFSFFEKNSLGVWKKIEPSFNRL